MTKVEDGREAATEELAPAAAPPGDRVPRFDLTVADGPDAGLHWSSTLDRASIGTLETNDLVLRDETVSRFHCEIRMLPEGPRLRDLGSLNGTFVDGLHVIDAYLRNGSLIRAGRSTLRLTVGEATNVLPISDRHEFGTLVGSSVAARTAFALLELAASSASTVLLDGETGTGKEWAAIALHEMGARRDAPFLVVDCGAIPSELLESELFGHEKGAFTGAVATRRGAFEEADGGTVFLDEIGELPLDLQPKLLRVLERRQVRRVGSNAFRPIDVRVIAATNRDLRTLVNTGRFRSDLYYRLAVLRVRLPSLRERPEDIPVIARRLLASLRTSPGQVARILDPASVHRMQQAMWPGNVRELRNYLERCLVFGDALPPVGDDGHVVGPGAPGAREVNVSRPLREVRDEAVRVVEREYLLAILGRHAGNITAAAKAAGIDRAYFYRLLWRHRIR